MDALWECEHCKRKVRFGDTALSWCLNIICEECAKMDCSDALLSAALAKFGIGDGPERPTGSSAPLALYDHDEGRRAWIRTGGRAL